MLGLKKLPVEMQLSELRAQIGATVIAALSLDPDIVQVPTTLADVFIHDTFLTQAECAALMVMIDGNCAPSKLYDQEAWKDYRTSSTCDMDRTAEIVLQTNTKISGLLGIDLALGEPLQGQRYKVGQQYRDHSDFFYINQPYWPDMDEQGGQRTWTAMAYLNEVDEAGETEFPEIGLRVEPRVGRLLVWNNMKRDGAPNPRTRHRATPVVAGGKYVITKWFRERPWKSLDRPLVSRPPEALPATLSYSINVQFPGAGGKGS